VQGLDPSSDRPAYRQIADQLRAAIASRMLAEGAQLPSETALIEQYGVARGTVRQAIALLRSEGVVVADHGRGNFVRRHPPVKRLASDRFRRQYREQGKAAFIAESESEGRTPTVQVQYVGPDKASAAVAALLQLDEGDQVLVRRRLYLADDWPMETATSYIPWDLADGTAMVEHNPGPGGIYARLEDAGHPLERFREDVTARMPSPDEARMLRLSSGVPVFSLIRTAYDTAGRPVEVCDTVMAADRYVLSYELPAR
jgi:GntR family transcriptional regulator